MIHKNLIIVLTKELFQDMIQLNIIKTTLIKRSRGTGPMKLQQPTKCKVLNPAGKEPRDKKEI